MIDQDDADRARVNPDKATDVGEDKKEAGGSQWFISTSTSLSDEVEDQDEVHFNSNRVAAESWRLQFKINIVLKLYFDL